MNTRGGTMGTAMPGRTKRRALPTATGHWQWKGTIPTGGPSRTRRGTAADMRQHTAAHTWHEPDGGHPLYEETTRHPWDRLTSPKTPAMGVKTAAEIPAISRDDPREGRPTLPGRAPRKYRQRRARNAPRGRLSIGRAGESGTGLRDFCSGHPRMRASLGSPTTRAIEHEH